MAADKLQEIISRFYDDPLGYVKFAFPWREPGPLADHDGPDVWQEEQLRYVGEQIKTNPLGIIRDATASGHGVGKAHPVTVMIDAPSGRKVWGDIAVGDSVFASDGSVTEVVATQRYSDIPIYRVTFDDRSYCDVSGGHLWSVRGRQERRKGLDGWRTLETEELLRLGVKRKNGQSMARQWEIPVQKAVEYPEQATAIDPYYFGVWLGDGKRGESRYCKPSKEVANKLKERGLVVTDHQDDKGHGVSGLFQKFKRPEFQCGSHERYVPDEYKFNIAEVRRDVLSGLIDTDGEVHNSGSVGYCSTSLRLTEDVVWLARSLGYKAMIQSTPKQGRFNGEDKRIAYRCTINMPENLFTHAEKRAAFKPSTEERYQKRWIDSIERIGSSDAMCITVEAEDGLYLANDFIVTHNSADVAWLILWAMSTRPHINGVVTANTFPQLNTKTWRELAVWHKRAINGGWFQWTATKFFHKAHPETWFVSPIANSEHNSEAFAGQHGRHSLIIYDEASAIPDVIWEVSSGVNDPRAMWFAFGNPTQNTGRFKECFGRFRSRWNTRHVDSRDCKMPNKEELQKDVEAYGEDSDFVRVRIKGEFPRVGSTQFISAEVVEQAMQRKVDVPLGTPKLLGVDVARFGDDQTVIVRRHGRKVEKLTKLRELDTMQVAARVAEIIKNEHPNAVFVDGVGIGAGVVDRLRHLGYEIIEVLAGAKPDEQNKAVYFNKRAEMWGRMREWLSGAGLPEDRELVDDLIGLEYGYDTQMRIQLEKKEDMKKRGLASPDCADALALTFAYETPPVAVHAQTDLMPEYFEDF